MSVPSGGNNIGIFKQRENNLFSVTCVKNSHGYFPPKFCKREKKITFGLKLMRECFPKEKIFSENKKIGNRHSRKTPLPHPVPGSPPVLGASDRPSGSLSREQTHFAPPPSIFQWEEEGRVQPLLSEASCWSGLLGRGLTPSPLSPPKFKLDPEAKPKKALPSSSQTKNRGP